MDKYERHETICAGLNRMYRQKNTDYDDSFSKSFKTYGMAMPAIRLEDKLNRIKALALRGGADAKVSDESLVDTLMDLANYAIMTIIELEGER